MYGAAALALALRKPPCPCAGGVRHPSPDLCSSDRKVANTGMEGAEQAASPRPKVLIAFVAVSLLSLAAMKKTDFNGFADYGYMKG